MKVLSFQEYNNLESKNGLFLFTLRNYCGLCKKATENIQENESSFKFDTFEVACETEDEIFSLNLMAVPFFILFKNDENIWTKAGILYDKQMKEMEEAWWITEE